MRVVIWDRAEFQIQMWLLNRYHVSSLFFLCPVLHSCNNFRPGSEMESHHVWHNLVLLLFLWSSSRALPVYWPSFQKYFFWKMILVHSTNMHKFKGMKMLWAQCRRWKAPWRVQNLFVCKGLNSTSFILVLEGLIK